MVHGFGGVRETGEDMPEAIYVRHLLFACQACVIPRTTVGSGRVGRCHPFRSSVPVIVPSARPGFTGAQIGSGHVYLLVDTDEAKPRYEPKILQKHG